MIRLQRFSCDALDLVANWFERESREDCMKYLTLLSRKHVFCGIINVVRLWILLAQLKDLEMLPIPLSYYRLKAFTVLSPSSCRWHLVGCNWEHIGQRPKLRLDDL